MNLVQKNWMFELYDTLSHDMFTKMALTLWSVWYARRKAIHEAVFQSPFQTIAFVNSYINELEQIPKVAVQQASTPACAKVAEQWLSPPQNLFKINADGAVARNRYVGVQLRQSTMTIMVYIWGLLQWCFKELMIR